MVDSEASFWDRQVDSPTHHNWLGHPLVRDYANRWIGGSEPLWPLDWFQRSYLRRFPFGLSVGCGTGALERDVLRRGICDRMDAFDASEASLTAARDAAAAEGFVDRIDYRHQDFDCVRLPPRRYDIVFFHQSLHHVSRMERLLRQVMTSMKSGGLLYLDEYIGPSRTYWNDRSVAWYRTLYRMLPLETRYEEELQLPVQWDDLTEAIRSGEIISRVRIGFNVKDFRGYGGNVLAVFFPAMLPGRIAPALVSSLIECEKALLQGGAPHFYAVIVAEPKRGLAAALARVRYLIDPKLRRLDRDFRVRFGSGRRHAREEDVFRL